MRIQHKIFFGYLAIVAVSIVLVAAFLLTLSDIQRNYSNLLLHDQQVLLYANNLRYSVERQVLAERTYEQVNDPAQQDEYAQASRDQQAALDGLSTLTAANPQEAAALDDIKSALARYSAAAQEGMRLASLHEFQELLNMKANEGDPARQALDTKLTGFIERQNRLVDQRQRQLSSDVQEASNRLLYGAIIGIAATLLAATLLTEGITSPLRKLMRNVQLISAGDLQTPVAVRSQDELGELAAVLETMRQRLATTAAQYEALLMSAREEAEILASTRLELEEANADLEQALVTEHEARRHIESMSRLKAEFTSMVSHELKTPVSYVYNYAGALKEHNESLNEGQRREFLTAIQSEAQHLLTLIDDIMAVSLLESGGLSHRFVATDLRKIVDSVVKDQQLTTRRHTLTVKGPDTLPLVADPTRLKQVMNNLLSNAIKYSPQGGPVEVRLRANPGDGTAIIYVRDSGIGIRPDDVPKLFDRFTRIQRRETMAIPGSGLGLYIAHHVVEAHGGRLSLEPAPGKGTIAQVVLPLVPRVSGGTDGASNPAEIRQAGKDGAAGDEVLVAEAALVGAAAGRDGQEPGE